MTDRPQDFPAIKTQTHAVYARQAAAWDAQRALQYAKAGLYEKGWLTKWLNGLPTPADLLDLGCGSGRPIADYLLGLGHRLTGCDYSPAMIDLARTHFPQAQWQVADMRDLKTDQSFDGVLSWDGFFHLSPEEQRIALPRMATLVRQGGAMLLTVGHGEGEVTGTVNGETVYHGSLSTSEYLSTMERAGFSDVTLTLEDESAWGRSVLLARNKQNAD